MHPFSSLFHAIKSAAPAMKEPSFSLVLAALLRDAKNAITAPRVPVLPVPSIEHRLTLGDKIAMRATLADDLATRQTIGEQRNGCFSIGEMRRMAAPHKPS